MPEEKSNLENEKPLMSWKSHEHLSSDRSVLWYLAMIFIAALCEYVLYLDGNWMGMALVGVALLVILVSRLGNHEVSCDVFEKGLVVDSKVFEFSEFKNFFFANGDVPKVRLQRNGRFASQVSIPMIGVNAEDVRAILSKHLPEEKEVGEDMVDRINRLIRF